MTLVFFLTFSVHFSLHMSPLLHHRFLLTALFLSSLTSSSSMFMLLLCSCRLSNADYPNQSYLCLTLSLYHIFIVVYIINRHNMISIVFIMMKRQELQLATKCPVGEVATKRGFSGQSDFSHMFRKTYGVTPREYRKLQSIKGSYPKELCYHYNSALPEIHGKKDN